MGPTYDSQMQQARNVMIESLVWQGKYNQRNPHPISVTFMHPHDVVEILLNRKYLPNGIFVSKEFGENTERECRFLKPILPAANNISKYKRKCQLEGDHLVIKGHHYSRENITRHIWI